MEVLFDFETSGFVDLSPSSEKGMKQGTHPKQLRGTVHSFEASLGFLGRNSSRISCREDYFPAYSFEFGDLFSH